MLFLYPVFFYFALSHICLRIQFYFLLFFIFSSYLFLFHFLMRSLIIFVYFSLGIIFKKNYFQPVPPTLLYCTLYTYILHSFFVCASYILLHSLFFLFCVFCASFLCLFLIAFSLIYGFSFFHFLCIFKSSFLNSLYILSFLVFVLFALYLFNNFFIVFIFSVPGYTSIKKIILFTCFFYLKGQGGISTWF